jgi:glycerol-3-phosphate dehydrogenase (NAD(P)+)
MKQITVIGEGAWGSALASILAYNGYEPLVWAYHTESCNEINTKHTNSRFLQNVRLNPAIKATTDIQEALHYSSIIFIAIPTNYIRQTLQPHTNTQSKLWIIGSKGLELSRGLVSSQILDQLFPNDKKVVIAGPSFAVDVINQQPTGLVVASTSVDARLQTINLLKNDFITLQESHDVIGVQYASFLKNIYALGMGMLRGAQYEDNTCALYLVKALHEMQTIITAQGGQKETAYGLAGLGDLYLTASSMKSKNMRFGFELGSGKALEELKKSWVNLPEGVMAVEVLDKKSIKIVQSLYNILFKQHPVYTMVDTIK